MGRAWVRSEERKGGRMGAGPQAGEGGRSDGFKAEKVIVFTHFWTHMRLIMQSLSARGADYAVFKKDRKPADKEEALLKFQVLPPFLPPLDAPAFSNKVPHPQRPPPSSRTRLYFVPHPLP